jgi:hypothetical protein
MVQRQHMNRQRWPSLILKTFAREKVTFLACNSNKAFLTNCIVKHYTMWTYDEVCRALSWNLFVMSTSLVLVAGSCGGCVHWTPPFLVDLVYHISYFMGVNISLRKRAVHSSLEGRSQWEGIQFTRMTDYWGYCFLILCMLNLHFWPRLSLIVKR